MTKRLKSLFAIIMFTLLFALIGGTGGRYFINLTLHGDFLRPLGSIILPHPEWSSLWNEGKQAFVFKDLGYTAIQYAVSNKFGDKINPMDNESYYIRLVDKDGGNNLPVQYKMSVSLNEQPVNPAYNYDNVPTLDKQSDGQDHPTIKYDPVIGYGPFDLASKVETTEYYAVWINYITTDYDILSVPQTMYVQMLRKRSETQIEVLDKQPLKIEYEYEEKVEVEFNYINFAVPEGGNNRVVATKEVTLQRGQVIDSANTEELGKLGLLLFEDGKSMIPDSSTYLFKYYTSKFTTPEWKEVSTITIPTDISADIHYVNVYLAKRKVTVTFKYMDISVAPNVFITSKTVVLDRGMTIDSGDIGRLTELGLIFADNTTDTKAPVGYKYYNYASAFTGWNNGVSKITIPLNEPLIDTYEITVGLHKITS